MDILRDDKPDLQKKEVFSVIKTDIAPICIGLRGDVVESVKFVKTNEHNEWSHHDHFIVEEMQRRVYGEWTRPLQFRISGTEFQKSVWYELCRLAYDDIVSYSDLAQRIGSQHAARAVGAAVGANTLAGVIPCHRVCPKSGGVGGYRWGSELKKKLLTYEQTHRRAILSVRWKL